MVLQDSSRRQAVSLGLSVSCLGLWPVWTGAPALGFMLMAGASAQPTSSLTLLPLPSFPSHSAYIVSSLSSGNSSGEPLPKSFPSSR